MSSKAKAASSATVSSDQIEQQIKVFLEQGGQVKKVDRGVSGIDVNKKKTFGSTKA